MIKPVLYKFFPFLIFFTLIISCVKKESEIPLNDHLISGVFFGENHQIADSLEAFLIFSFNEISNGSVEGGVRLVFIGHRGNFNKQKYMATHMIRLWQEDNSDQTMISGEVDLGEDIGPIAFSGLIVHNDTMHYALSGIHLNTSGVAIRNGDYMTDIPEIKSSNDYPGNYIASCSAPEPFDLHNEPFHVNITITDADYCCGGIMLWGFADYLDDNGIPYLWNATQTLDETSEIIGNMLYLSVSDQNFIIHTYNNWNPPNALAAYYLIYPVMHHNFNSYNGTTSLMSIDSK